MWPEPVSVTVMPLKMKNKISFGCLSILIGLSMLLVLTLWPKRTNKLYDYSETKIKSTFGTIIGELRGTWKDNDSDEKYETIRGNPYSLIVFLYTENEIEGEVLYKNLSLTSESGKRVIENLNEEASIHNLVSDDKHWASISISKLTLDYVPHDLSFTIQRSTKNSQVETEELSLRFVPQYKEKKTNDIISAMMGI